MPFPHLLSNMLNPLTVKSTLMPSTRPLKPQVKSPRVSIAWVSNNFRLSPLSKVSTSGEISMRDSRLVSKRLLRSLISLPHLHRNTLNLLMEKNTQLPSTKPLKLLVKSPRVSTACLSKIWRLHHNIKCFLSEHIERYFVYLF